MLAVCLCTGQMQLMKDELDDACLMLNTGITVSSIKWNSCGSVLAVSGVVGSSTGPAAAVVQFYSCYGKVCIAMRCQYALDFCTCKCLQFDHLALDT